VIPETLPGGYIEVVTQNENLSASVDRDAVAGFSAQAARWWDPEGSFAPLHRLNPVRLQFVRSRLLRHFGRDERALAPFEGLALADIGCGGGLVAEPMARLGFRVAGLDADPQAIAVARAHAETAKLAIDYRTGTAEAAAAAGEAYDVVLALEIIEHVADTEVFLAALGRLVKPGGAFIGATLNRTARSFLLAVLGAEYILHWLPPGTHDWRQFLRPSEFVFGLRRHGLEATELTGIGWDLGRGGWAPGRDLSINYMVMAERR
jgi:2-polyprenyl-6-hydroxyphenyl methylase / 3-demethylubiquinone-9 3-methyltransferase